MSDRSNLECEARNGVPTTASRRSSSVGPTNRSAWEPSVVTIFGDENSRHCPGRRTADRVSMTCVTLLRCTDSCAGIERVWTSRSGSFYSPPSWDTSASTRHRSTDHQPQPGHGRGQQTLPEGLWFIAEGGRLFTVTFSVAAYVRDSSQTIGLPAKSP